MKNRGVIRLKGFYDTWKYPAKEFIKVKEYPLITAEVIFIENRGLFNNELCFEINSKEEAEKYGGEVLPFGEILIPDMVRGTELVGKKILLADGGDYDKRIEASRVFFTCSYFGEKTLGNIQIDVKERKEDQFFVKITGILKYYEDDKILADIEIEGWFDYCKDKLYFG